MRTNRIRVHPCYEVQYREAVRLRKDYNLTGSEIARRIGLSKKTVSVWLKDQSGKGAVRVQASHAGKYRKAINLFRRDTARTVYSIAKELGIPEALVRYWIKQEKKHAEQTKQSDQATALH